MKNIYVEIKNKIENVENLRYVHEKWVHAEKICALKEIWMQSKQNPEKFPRKLCKIRWKFLSISEKLKKKNSEKFKYIRGKHELNLHKNGKNINENFERNWEIFGTFWEI